MSNNKRKPPAASAKGRKKARHAVRASAIRSQRVKDAKRDIRNSGRRGPTGG